MKTPPPHGLVCAAGVFVLGRHCPYSGEVLLHPEARRAVCQRRSKCHLLDTLLPRGTENLSAALPFHQAAQPHTSYGPVPEKSSCARNPAGQSASAGRNAVFPACFLPRVCPIARLPLRAQTKTPPSSGKHRQRAACCFYQAAEELSSSLLVWDSASSGFSGSVVSGSAVSSSSGI